MVGGWGFLNAIIVIIVKLKIMTQIVEKKTLFIDGRFIHVTHEGNKPLNPEGMKAIAEAIDLDLKAGKREDTYAYDNFEGSIAWKVN